MGNEWSFYLLKYFFNFLIYTTPSNCEESWFDDFQIRKVLIAFCVFSPKHTSYLYIHFNISSISSLLHHKLLKDSHCVTVYFPWTIVHRRISIIQNFLVKSINVFLLLTDFYAVLWSYILPYHAIISNPCEPFPMHHKAP